MALHLLKMCVGVDSVARLRELQAQRLDRQRASGQAPELRHLTRNMPRRADEIVGEGSLYWIIKGHIRARQRILRLERLDDATSLKRCAVVLDTKIVETQPRRARPMQGWRYLPAADAPADLAHSDFKGAPDMPPQMMADLRELGLL
jgi:hypothetical protein